MVGGVNLVGCQVWYTYYDVSSQKDADECRRQNPDVIITPDQIPLEKMDYAFLNGPTKTIVRKLLFALSKRTLAHIRGKFSGKVSIPNAELNMDYQMLTAQADDEYKSTIDELDKRLERMSPSEILKKQAEIVESTKTILAAKPLKMKTC